MPVKNIECQIAQAQIGRYLSGDVFDGDALSQLEAHVSKCSDCSSVLSQKKAALQAMLGGHGLGSAPATAAVVIEDDEDEAPQLNPAIEAFLQRREKPAKKAKATKPAKAVVEQTVEKATTPSTFWKPLILSGALAAVLIGMSFVVKNPTNLFGDRAASAAAAESTSEPAVDTTAKSTAPITSSSVPGFTGSEQQEPEDLEAGEATGKLPEPPKNALDQVPVSGDSSTAATTEDEKESTETPKQQPKPVEEKKVAPVQKPVVKTTTAAKPKPKTRSSTRRGNRSSSTKRSNQPSGPLTIPVGGESKNSIRVYDSNGNPIH